MASRRIGKYEIDEAPLSRDAFGALYAGVDSKSGEAVLVKEIEAQERASQSPRTLPGNGALKQPALITPNDLVESGGVHYAVCRRPAGKLLSEKLPELSSGGLRGRYNLLKAILEVTTAVETLHRSGIIHGGINPGVIFYQESPAPHAYLTCFKAFEPRPTSSYLRSAENMPYLAQEQLRGGGSFGTDIYALGMLLYLAFSQTPAYPQGSIHQQAEQIVWGNCAPFTPNFQDLDELCHKAIGAEIDTLGAVATKAIQRKPSARYLTVMELRRTLEQLASRLAPDVLGLNLYQRGQHDLAVAVLEEATHNADPTLAHLLLGRIYGFKMNAYGKAVAEFRRALKDRPDLDAAHLDLAELYARNRKFDLAKREVGQLLEKRPNDLGLLMAYARILNEGGSATGALNVLANIYQANPYYLEAYILAIRLALKAKDLNQAEKICSRAIERIIQIIEKGNLDLRQVAEIYHLRGVLHKEKGRPARAITWLEKALQQQPDHTASHLRLAELYIESGQEEKAMFHFITSLNLNPDQDGILDQFSRLFKRRPKQRHKADKDKQKPKPSTGGVQ